MECVSPVCVHLHLLEIASATASLKTPESYNICIPGIGIETIFEQILNYEHQSTLIHDACFITFSTKQFSKIKSQGSNLKKIDTDS